jgi:hypothetical protein
MTLSKATLKAELLKIMDSQNPNFVGWPATPATAITNFAAAYNTYATQATDISGDHLILANLPGFIAAITSAMPPPSPGGTLANYASTMATAFTTYWTAAPFTILIPPPSGIGGTGVFSIEVTSLVTVINSAILSTGILTQLNQQFDSADDAADAVADVWHTATTTAITVVIVGLDTTPPPAGPLPIINTALVY